MDNQINLQEAMAMAKSTMFRTVDEVMRDYSIPGYLMEYVLIDIMAALRENTIERMLSIKREASNNETDKEN